MNSKPTPEHLRIYVAHTMATLPDSLRLRKIILVTALKLLPRDFNERIEVVKLLESIRIHENTQLQFGELLKFKPDSKLEGDGK